MTSMTIEAPTFLPFGRAITRADLQALPDDGHRYELIDGVLIVTPAPRIRHQDIVFSLAVALKAAAPAHLKVLFAPVDVVLADDTVMEPDVLVAPRQDFTEFDLPTAPLLAVEVLSPSTRAFDLMVKKERLQRAGCPHYWVVDPGGQSSRGGSGEPSIIAWTLTDGEYVEAAQATGDESFHVTAPFEVAFTPASLLD